MSTVQIDYKDFKSNNLVSQISSKPVKEISRKFLQTEKKQLPCSEALIKLITKSPYPNFRFFCPHCASLDVFITVNKTMGSIFVDCLECKKRWLEARLSKT